MSSQPGDSRNPYQQAGFPPSDVQQRGSSRAGCVFAGIAGGGVLLALLCCGGIAGLGWFGLAVFSEEVESLLRDNPVLVEHLGAIENFEIDLVATATEDEDDVFVFKVTGQNGSGVVTAKSITLDDGSEDIAWARLRLPDGQTVELLPEVR